MQPRPPRNPRRPLADPEVLRCAVVPSPAGGVTVTWGDAGLRYIGFCQADGATASPASWRREAVPAFGAGQQLAAYFAGQRMDFDLPLDPRGTAFQRQVWQALRQIPYGATASYGQVAERVGRPGAARAVGSANHRNPLPIVVPCHRVIGADGALVGYGGGLRFKRFLLDLEARSAGTLLALGERVAWVRAAG